LDECCFIYIFLSSFLFSESVTIPNGSLGKNIREKIKTLPVAVVSNPTANEFDPPEALFLQWV
jgi:hypothetical protein